MFQEFKISRKKINFQVSRFRDLRVLRFQRKEGFLGSRESRF
jgi:hypothetical protein